MSKSGNHFRTVAFGGFHKQDVLNYITQTSQRNQEHDAGLAQAAQQAREELAELTGKYEVSEIARKKYAADCENMSQALAERTNALETASRELTALQAKHTQAAARLVELEEVLPGLREQAQAYAELKDHTATIEMEAHRKAQEIIGQAQRQAEELRGEMEEWLRRVQSTYQLLRTDVTATITHLSGELERGKKALDEAAPAFRQHDETLAALLGNDGEQTAEPCCNEGEGAAEHG